MTTYNKQDDNQRNQGRPDERQKPGQNDRQPGQGQGRPGERNPGDRNISQDEEGRTRR